MKYTMDQYASVLCKSRGPGTIGDMHTAAFTSDTRHSEPGDHDLPEALDVPKLLKEFLTVAEVAELLGLRPVTIYRWCRAGRLASVKIGKEWRIRRAALDALLGRSLRNELGDHGDEEEPMHETSLETKDVARRLLRQDAGAQPDAAALALAVERACGRLRGRLVPLIGQVGFTALLRRALHLAQAESPSLDPLTVDESGEPCIEGARAFAAAHTDDPDLVEAALVALLAHFVALLDTFIGEALTRRVIGERWPMPTDDTETDQ
jgi:excisionase family DNA binding protein